MVLAFAGRRPGTAFPAENVAAVRAAIAAIVGRERPRRVVGSAAAGADLLVVEEALRTGAKVELLLAGPRDGFRAESVADKGEPWAARFDDLLAREGVVVREVPRDEDAEAAYRAVTAAIADRAEALAAAGEPIAVLVVSSPPGPPGHSEELAEAAESHGWPILRIDPLDPAG